MTGWIFAGGGGLMACNLIHGYSNPEIDKSIDDVLETGTGAVLVEYNGQDLEITRVPAIKHEVEPAKGEQVKLVKVKK